MTKITNGGIGTNFSTENASLSMGKSRTDYKVIQLIRSCQNMISTATPVPPVDSYRTVEVITFPLNFHGDSWLAAYTSIAESKTASHNARQKKYRPKGAQVTSTVIKFAISMNALYAHDIKRHINQYYEVNSSVTWQVQRLSKKM